MSTRVNEFQILNVDDAELMRVIQEGTLSLNWDETHAIQKHFAKLQRKSTDVELETILSGLVYGN